MVRVRHRLWADSRCLTRADSRQAANGCTRSSTTASESLHATSGAGHLSRFDVNQLATLPTSGTKTEYEAKDQPGETAPRSARGGGTSGLT